MPEAGLDTSEGPEHPHHCLTATRVAKVTRLDERGGVTVDGPPRVWGRCGALAMVVEVLRQTPTLWGRRFVTWGVEEQQAAFCSLYRSWRAVIDGFRLLTVDQHHRYVQ